VARESSELARKFIDGSLQKSSRKGGAQKPARQPSKAAYARAVRLARLAIEELAQVARRVQPAAPRGRKPG